MCCLSMNRILKSRTDEPVADRGFTFVEVAVLVVLIGIVAAVARPMFGSAMGEARLEAAATEIETAFRYARQTSIGSGRECRVTVDAASDALLVEQIAYADSLLLEAVGGITRGKIGPLGYEPMKHPVRKWENYRIDFAGGERFRGVDITTANLGSENSITFDRLGRPSQAGLVVVVMDALRIVILLNPATGRLSRLTG